MASSEWLHRKGPPPGCQSRWHLQDVVHELHDRRHPLVGGEYLELVPHVRIRHTDRFEDPNLPGTLLVTVSLEKVPCGTDVGVVQEGIPDVIPLEACYLGWQESLALLASS